MKILLGFLLILWDNVKSMTKTPKHQMFIQSWWRSLIILTIVGFVFSYYSMFIGIPLLILFFLYLAKKQERYAKKRRVWNDIDENEHLIVPIVTSILIVVITSIYIH